MFLGFFVKCDINIDDNNPRFDGPRERSNERTRIGGRDNDRIDFFGDEVFDGIDLSIDIGLRMHSDRKKGQVSSLRDMLYRSLLHVFEKFICERLHDEADDRLFRILCITGLDAGNRKNADKQGGDTTLVETFCYRLNQ